ncbi:hypothetical protein D3C80_1864800 [compost metagenome]
MTGTNEGDDVVLDFGAAQAIWSFGPQQQGKEVARHVFLPVHARFTQRDGV